MKRRLTTNFVQLFNYSKHYLHQSNIRMEFTTKVESMRISYDISSIDDQLESNDPIELFQKWFLEATENENIQEPNAMNLATSSKDGFPSSRIVLLKGFSHDGFRFFTNYESQKGRQLLENPRAAITFYWEPLQKQIRIFGTVKKISDDESTEYFHKRPIENQIGSIVSRQTTVIPSREYLEDLKTKLTKQYVGKVIPKPDHWGGFQITPVTMEFWCGGKGRLHDRIRFRYPEENEAISKDVTKEGANGWLYERLAP